MGQGFSDEPYGIGVHKGHPEFVAFLDQWICQIKQTGTWSRLYGEWIEPITGRNAEPPADQVPAGQLR